MRKVTTNDVVKLKFSVFVHDGTLIETTDKESVDMVLSKGVVMPGIEKLLMGKKVGDKVVKGKISKKDAFGDWEKEKEVVVPLSEIPRDIELEEGGVLHSGNEAGMGFSGTIKEVYDDFVVIDYNNPLVGKNLLIDFEIMDINAFDPDNPPQPPTAIRKPQEEEDKKAAEAAEKS
jgi:FKBP-type peptidyl-prolyl cis-trans isomerase 2